MIGGRNLLVLMSDEHQARAMGCAGHPFVQTPNLDRLAARGTRFTQAYTPCPICVPARASFATGLPVHLTRLWDNAMPYDGSIRGWGHALQDAGISVESVGKLHYRSEEDPAGFDAEHIPMMVADGVGMVWASIREEGERVVATGRMLGERIGPGHSAYTDYDAAVTSRARDWLRERPREGSPWCLFVGLVAPHFPLVVPTEYFDLYPPDSMPDAKLRPASGFRRHPWIEKQNAFMDSEGKFHDDAERRAAMSSYYGLCTWLDSNVGRILDTLDETGLAADTTVVYTSDHGDNVGARGLWGKSNFYEESVAIPLILAEPFAEREDSTKPPAPRICDTPTSLLDLAVSIPAHFGIEFSAHDSAQPLQEILAAPENPDREILSQYHAAGAVSGAYMLRRGRWKYVAYLGFEPELFDLDTDSEETRDLAPDPEFADVLVSMSQALRQALSPLDPESANALAFADQRTLVERHGGRDAAMKLGAPGATPPPSKA